MSEEGFKLPGSPYEELANIIVAYGTRDEASNPGDISKLDVVHQSSVSRNNAFLVSIGILQGEREKLVTEQGRALARALSRRDRAGIKRNWREVVSRNEFMQNVLSAVKLREGIFASTLQAYIAHYAGQPRNKPVMTGASAVIGILKAASLLHEEAGMLVATYDDLAEVSGQSTTPPPATGGAFTGAAVAGGDEAGQEARHTADRQEVSVSTQPGDGRVTVHVHVNCGPEELGGLAPKINRLLRELEDG